MKVLALLLMMTASSGWAEPHAAPAVVSQDPLMRQILHRQLTQNNGGITAAVRVGSGQAVELHVNESALAALKPVAGLAPHSAHTSTAAPELAIEKDEKPSKGDLRKAKPQLEALQKKHAKWR